MMSETKPRTITLTTDFGLSDVYVGVMKSAVLSIAPQAQIIDITHDIPAQDIFAGALALETAVAYAPDGAIHVAVVDPGVGTGRSAIAIEVGGQTLIGPDNGLLSLALASIDGESTEANECQACRLTNAEYFLNSVSDTFHGRDIFAPVAAHRANGIPFEKLGEPIADPRKSIVQIHLPEVEWESTEDGDAGRDATSSSFPSICRAEILTIDHFGNLITNLSRGEFADACDASLWNAVRVHVGAGRQTIQGLHTTFGNVGVNEPVAYFGSTGRLEVAVRNGDAAETFRCVRGDGVEIELPG